MVEVPGYRAAYIPRALKTQKPLAVSLGVGAVRGYRPIVSYWVVKKPFAEVASMVLKEMTPNQGLANIGERDLELRGSLTGQKTLADRVVQIWIQKGRPVIKRDKGMTSYEFEDEDSYTRIRLNERPLLFGRMPVTWSKEARNAKPLPKSFPGLPFKHSNLLLTRWTSDITPAGATQYWIDWYVPESTQTLIPKLLSQLRGQIAWRVPSEIQGQSVRIEPAKNRNNFGWMQIESGGSTFEELPANMWTRISVSWCDPTSVR